MPIAKDKVATRLIIPKELKANLEQIAKKKNRSLNNLMATILNDYVETQNEVFTPENKTDKEEKNSN